MWVNYGMHVVLIGHFFPSNTHPADRTPNREELFLAALKIGDKAASKTLGISRRPRAAIGDRPGLAALVFFFAFCASRGPTSLASERCLGQQPDPCGR